jgi:two-component system, OmpR family, response regulator AdeR
MADWFSCHDYFGSLVIEQQENDVVNAHKGTVAMHHTNMADALILIVEDEHEISEILSSYLKRSGLRTAVADNGLQAIELHKQLKPDLVLLDIRMPVMDGWKVLAEIRHVSATPVIMLTAFDQDIDILTGLRIGADDYIIKPFNPAVVVARVYTVLRRGAQAQANTAQISLLQLGALQINLDTYEVKVLQNNLSYPVDLTLTEFRILSVMARAPKKVFSRDELLDSCLPEGDTLERTVDSHVSKLRKKLETNGVQDMIQSVRGVGYRLRENM